MQRFAVISGILWLGACVSRTGRLEINRFQHEEFPYAVFYSPDGQPTAPLGGAWRLDNYAVPRGGDRYVEKQGPTYLVERRYDVDGDGRAEVGAREFFYDLLLEHAQVDAALWVRTVPIEPADRDKDLSVLARRYLDGAARTGTVAARFGLEQAAPERAASVQTLGESACSLSKRPAYRVDFALSPTPGADGAPAPARERGSVVLVRTGYLHRVKNPRGMVADYPVIMLVGLSAQPQDFARLAPDFEVLLGRTVLGDRGQGLSMHGESTCTASEATSGASAAEAREQHGDAERAHEPELNEAAQIPLAPEALPPAGAP
jgi:hypothetical protein